MMNFEEQFKNGFIVCPNTHSKLYWNRKDNTLLSSQGNHSYSIIDDIPILLKDKPLITESLETSDMTDKYQDPPKINHLFINKVKSKLFKDLRTRSSIKAFNIFNSYNSKNLCLAIGGGPLRHHKNLCNVNIDRFDNVDIVADAHYLPYRDECVDAIFCEAVLEHLYNPHLAVKEMTRVLKPEGIVLSITPFLQAYHGFPHHYQNYTLTGHKNLFITNGFEILESGTCVGPTYTIIMLNFQYLKNFIPGIFGSIISKVFLIFAMLFIKPLDLLFNYRHNSHELANTTYVLAKKKNKISSNHPV